MKSKKGQASLEFLVVLAALLVFIYFWISISISTTSRVSDSIKFRDAALAGKQLASSINSLCILSPGSSVELKLFFPNGTRISQNGKAFNITYKNESVEFSLACPSSMPKSLSGFNYHLSREDWGVKVQAS